jgi:hypothetical protein
LAGNKKARPKGRARPTFAPEVKRCEAARYPCTRKSPRPIGPW